MEIISSEIDSEKINLVTNSPVAGLILSHGAELKSKYEINDLNTTELIITKEALGLDSLDNIYFKVYLLGADQIDTFETGLFHIDVNNDREKFDYDALDLKQELDNLNYYDGMVNSLTEKKRFLEANDFFFNYIIFLKEKLNGNNFIQNIKQQIPTDTKSQ